VLPNPAPDTVMVNDEGEETEPIWPALAMKPLPIIKKQVGNNLGTTAVVGRDWWLVGWLGETWLLSRHFYIIH